MIETCTITACGRTLFCKRKITLVEFLVWLIAAQSQALPQESDCLRLCRLAQEENSKTGIRTSRKFLFCPCLEGGKDHHNVNEQDIIYKQRKRKSLLDLQPSQCPMPSATWAPSEDWTPSEVNVTFGQYANTDHWYVNCSWPSINDSYGKWNGILLRLEVDDKDEESLVKPVICFKLSKALTFVRINISSFSYHYPDPIYLKVIGLPYSREFDNISLFTPQYSTLVIPTTFATTVSTTGSDNTVAYAVSISVGVLAGLGLVAGLLAYFFGHKKLNITLPSGYKYHAFIIYSNEDKPWADKILKLLEGKHNLKCCIHYRDFAVGRPFNENMAASVYQSCKVIALFSNNFVNSDYCTYELSVAIGRQVHNDDRSLVVIRIDGVNFEHLPSELKDRSLIDYKDLLQRPLWKKNLLQFLESPLNSKTNAANGENETGTCTRLSRVDGTRGDHSEFPLLV